MAFIGNLLWFVFGGFVGGTMWLLSGLFMCCTVVGVPLGVACFRIARFAYCPFGKELVPVEWLGEKRIAGTGVFQLIWIVLPGWVLALMNGLIGVVFCCTLIGIPWGIAYFRLAEASFAPLGKRVVSKDYAKALRTKYYESKASAALGRGQGNGGATIIVENRQEPGGGGQEEEGVRHGGGRMWRVANKTRMGRAAQGAR